MAFGEASRLSLDKAMISPFCSQPIGEIFNSDQLCFQRASRSISLQQRIVSYRLQDGCIFERSSFSYRSESSGGVNLFAMFILHDNKSSIRPQSVVED